MFTPQQRRAHVRALGYSYAVLASRCACSRETIKRVLDGDRSYAFAERQLSKVLGVDLVEFFGPVHSVPVVDSPNRWTHFNEQNEHNT